MHVYFSTIVRGAPRERSGELVKLDWNTKKILGRVPLFSSDPALIDPNPRGHTRGGRGILVNSSELFAASYHTLHVFDHDLRPLPPIQHNLFCNLHELHWDGDAIWATSTDVDGAIKIDRHGRTLDEWWPREDPVLMRRFGLEPLFVKKHEDNRCKFVNASKTAPGHVHLNAIALDEGRPLALLNQFGAIVRLQPTQILVDDPTLRGAHNLVITARGEIIVNDTVNRAVRVYDRQGRLIRKFNLRSLAPVRRILARHVARDVGIWLSRHGRPKSLFYRLFGGLCAARPLFVRGLSETKRGSILVGISPAGLLELDLKTGELVDFHMHSRSVRDCVHGLVCRPAGSVDRAPN
jgi:hypothetical protein